MRVKRYRTKPEYVEAVRLTTDNWRMVERWCDGKTVNLGAHTAMRVETDTCRVWAYEGEYVVREEDGDYLTMRETMFEECYEEVPA